MSNERRLLAGEIFDEALERPLDQRAAFLDERCKGDAELLSIVQSLLTADGAGPFLDPPVRAAAVDILSEFGEAALIGERVGAYRLTEVIASGGMGTVFKGTAESNGGDPVAVKLIRRGMDTQEIIRRFQQERRTLAGLSHPNIARLLDGGMSERGVPYLVMEFIEGKSIDRYCDERQLTITERVKLVQTVCGAVQYAHQSLVIHRDIKPSNILVTSAGTPMLVDFGIAKLVSGETGTATVTATGMRLVTPQYASPEVVRGEPPSTSMDVYSLGLVLYELLTGRRPYELARESQREMERIICEEDPPVPSAAVSSEYDYLSPDGTAQRRTPELTGKLRKTTPQDLQRTLEGDLDTVVMMALRKDATRRYASVEQFAQDLERYLSGFPVLAQMDSLGYRTWKFIRRNRVAVAVGAGLIVTLLGGIAGTSYGLVAARREAERSRLEAAKAASISAFYQQMLASADPETGNADMKVRVMLDQAAGQIDRELAEQPEVWGAVKNSIGATYLGLGLFKEAEPHLRAVLVQRRDARPRDDAAYGQSLVNLSRLLRLTGGYDEATTLLDEALAISRADFGPQNEWTARALITKAQVCMDKGEFAEAEKLLRECVEMTRALRGEQDRDVTDAMEELGIVLAEQGRYDEAQALCRKALKLNRGLFGTEHVRLASSLHRLAMTLHKGGKLAEAEEPYREALIMYRKLLGNEHPHVARLLNNLGILIAGQEHREDQPEGEAMLQEALDLRRKIFGDEHVTVSVTLNNLASVSSAEDAEPLLRESLAISRKLFGLEDYRVAGSLQILAASLKLQGDYDGAGSLYEEALAIHRKKWGPDHINVSYSLLGLADVLVHRGEAQKAEPDLRACLEIRRKHLSPSDPMMIQVETVLARCLIAQRKFEEAESLLLASLAKLENAPAARKKEVDELATHLAELYDASGAPDRAVACRAKYGLTTSESEKPDTTGGSQ